MGALNNAILLETIGADNYWIDTNTGIKFTNVGTCWLSYEVPVEYHQYMVRYHALHN